MNHHEPPLFRKRIFHMGNSFNSTLRMPNKPVICKESPDPPPPTGDDFYLMYGFLYRFPVPYANVVPLMIAVRPCPFGAKIECVVVPETVHLTFLLPGRNGVAAEPAYFSIQFDDYNQEYQGKIKFLLESKSVGDMDVDLRSWRKI